MDPTEDMRKHFTADGQPVLHATEWPVTVQRTRELEREIEKLTEENVEANGRLDMQMKERAEEREAFQLLRTQRDALECENAALRRELLDELENMARQGCHTGKVERDYNGQVAVADDCYLKGLCDLEIAILNWAHDDMAGHPRAIVPADAT